MTEEIRYKIKVVRGAFTNTDFLDIFGAKKVENFDDEWIELDELLVNLDEVKQLQKLMVQHYNGKTDPWYMDGYEINNKNNMIVAFGADDGESGKIFLFERTNKNKIKEVQQYGISKGIPSEQMDFGDIGF